jgi:hypothetical protein
VLLVLSLCGCSHAFNDGVRAWAKGPAYSGAVQHVLEKQLDDTSLRLELMSLSGLQCLVDEDDKSSTSEKPSAACSCSRPTQAESGLGACKSWADALAPGATAHAGSGGEVSDGTATPPSGGES